MINDAQNHRSNKQDAHDVAGDDVTFWWKVQKGSHYRFNDCEISLNSCLLYMHVVESEKGREMFAGNNTHPLNIWIKWCWLEKIKEKVAET